MRKSNKLLAVLVSVLALAGCSVTKNSSTPSVAPSDSSAAPSTPSEAASSAASVEASSEASVSASSEASVDSTESTVSSSDSSAPVDPTTDALIGLEDYKNYVATDLDRVIKAIGDLDDEEVASAVEDAAEAGLAAIDAATTHAEVKAAFNAAKAAMANCIPLADGVFDFTGLDNDAKMEILGVLEAYAIRNGITGVSLFEDGGYVMYNDRVTLGTENYIIGYGFGTLAEGKITADLENEENAAWKRYYHTLNANDPGTANYLNDQGSEVADFYGYDHGGFFTTFMNDDKTGYKWVTEFANTLPESVDGKGYKWRFEVKVGDQLKYTTNSTMANRAAFNNRGVAKEDYVTAFKLLLNAKNGLFRGGELATATTGAIKGAQSYYEKTVQAADAEAAANISFDEVGIKTYEEAGKTYFEVEFVKPASQFNCIYYISSGLYQPVPQEFLDLVSVKNYLGFNDDKTESPVDNSLSLGAYALENWTSDQQVIYKKNPNYVYASTKYQIPGVKIKIHTAITSDREASFKEFLAGNTDSAGIPEAYLATYKNDPRTRQTIGSSNFKLNINATDKETWEYLFGEDGTVCSTAKEDYWEVEPALSNAHFVQGLSYAINRTEFADKRGSVGSVDYFSPAYMASQEIFQPEGEEVLEVVQEQYNSLEEHKNAVAPLLEGTTCGYSYDLAKDYFKMALTELVAEGKYIPGTKDNPTVIELEIAWQVPSHEEAYHKEIKQYLESAFNDPEVSDGAFKLEVTFWVGTVWSDVYYKKLMVGQYDIGFGSISGNTLDPLGFLNVLSSDPVLAGSFCLNWGTNTNDPLADVLVYDGKRWSFDALWSAANTGAAVSAGASVPLYTLDITAHDLDNGTWTSVIEFAPGVDAVTVSADDVVIFSRAFDFASAEADGWDYASVPGIYLDVKNDYAEVSVGAIGGTVTMATDETTGAVTITVTVPEAYAKYFAFVSGYDVYGTYSIYGSPAVENGYVDTVYCAFED